MHGIKTFKCFTDSKNIVGFAAFAVNIDIAAAVVYLKKGQNKALVLIANTDRKKVNGTFKINTAKLFGNNAKCEIREIIPAQYTYDKAKNDFYISSKKSFKSMPGKADSEFNAEFSKRGIRYFEVKKK